MAGLFSGDTNDVLSSISKQRLAANQALGSPYGKYAGIVQTGAGLADIGADATAGGGVGASDPRMQQMKEVQGIFSQVAQKVGTTTSPQFYQELSKALSARGYSEQAQKAADKAAEVEKSNLSMDVSKQQLEVSKQQLSDTQTKAAKEEAMRKDLAALPANATDDQIRSVIMKYGDANTIIADLQRRDSAREAAAARKYAADQAAQLRRDLAQQRAEDKQTNKPKDVAEKEGSLALLEQTSGKLESFLPALEGNTETGAKPTVDFSLSGQARAWLDSKSSSPSKATLQMAQIKKAINQQVQIILQAAKGTQTEGDAKRAAENIISSLESNSNAGVAQAIRDVIDLEQRTKVENQAYLKARGYGSSEPAAGTATNPIKLK